jgi:hypothetical protein
MRSSKGSTRALLVLACLLPVAVPAAAKRQPDGPAPQIGKVIARADLVKTTVAVPGADLEIHAEPHVEIGRLLEGLSHDEAASTDDLYQRINANRKRLYGDVPLVLSIEPRTNGAEATAGGNAAGVPQLIYSFYKATSADDYFYITCKNPSTASTMFIAALDGLVDAWVLPSKGAAYRYLGRVYGIPLDALTQYQTAKKKTTLGYAFLGDGVSHIVVYCFK